MLGHEVPFSYCRSPAAELPCRKIFDCWWEAFDVEGFIREHFSPQQVSKILVPSKPKTATIVELIEKARQAGQAREGQQARQGGQARPGSTGRQA